MKYNRGNIITGRDSEIEDILLTLCKKSKRGSILVGEPGVGKTAIVNAINARLIQRTVPRQLIGCQIFNLDVPYVFSKFIMFINF
jgi:ATP-dependent Clp protease ATP-binding subunit ClpA